MLNCIQVDCLLLKIKNLMHDKIDIQKYTITQSGNFLYHSKHSWIITSSMLSAPAVSVTT